MASERPLIRVTLLSAEPLAHLDASSAPLQAKAERYGMTGRAVKECLKSHSVSGVERMVSSSSFMVL